MRILNYLLIVLQIALTSCAHAETTIKPVGCDFNTQLQSKRSAELLKLAQADQADRAGSYELIKWNKVNSRDMDRRIRVGQFFGEGCLSNASDYASAAIIYQHGVTADHYYQAFVWSNRAIKLGDLSQRWLAAASLDRYLVKIGHKQLFGTQISKGDDGIWCIQPVEPTFPEPLRIDYVRLSVKDQISNTLKAMASSQPPKDVKDCKSDLKSSPKGTVLGFW